METHLRPRAHRPNGDEQTDETRTRRLRFPADHNETTAELSATADGARDEETKLEQPPPTPTRIMLSQYGEDTKFRSRIDQNAET